MFFVNRKMLLTLTSKTIKNIQKGHLRFFCFHQIFVFVFSTGKSHSWADSATWWDLLPVGTQLFHGFQQRQLFPCRPSFWDHVNPGVSFYWAQHYQLLWDAAHRPERGHFLVPQVRRSFRSWLMESNTWVGPTLLRFVPFRMHLALKAYQELLLTVNEMDRSQDESIRQSSSVIKSKIVGLKVYI